jgi:peptidoglycan/LPS O-acetylase OafA/YrhL
MASRCAAAAVIVLPIARVAHSTLTDASSLYLTNGASIDTLALGCLLALHRDRLAAHRWFNAAVDSRYLIPVLYVVAAASVLIGWRPSVLLRTPIIGVATLLLIERCIRHPDRGVGRLLATRGLVYLGSASYSVYLWQQLFLNPSSMSWTAAYPANLLAALTIGLLSWHLVEHPRSTIARGLRATVASPAAVFASWTARRRRRAAREKPAACLPTPA